MLKISDYKNPRFSLRCLNTGITPVSLKLKNNIGTYRSNCIIHKAERKLLNKRIRNINNTIENHEHAKYMYDCELKGIVSIEIYKECEKYIDNAKETRHNKVLQRQVSKFERLSEKNSAEKSGCSKQCHSGIYMHRGRYMYQQEPELQHQNTINQKKKCVINLSDVPLTPTEEAVLAHGPNFAVTPKKSAHSGIYDIFRNGLPKVKHQCCRRIKI